MQGGCIESKIKLKFARTWLLKNSLLVLEGPKGNVLGKVFYIALKIERATP